MQNCSIASALQHGRRENPLYPNIFGAWKTFVGVCPPCWVCPAPMVTKIVPFVFPPECFLSLHRSQTNKSKSRPFLRLVNLNFTLFLKKQYIAINAQKEIKLNVKQKQTDTSAEQKIEKIPPSHLRPLPQSVSSPFVTSFSRRLLLMTCWSSAPVEIQRHQNSPRRERDVKDTSLKSRK